MGRYALDSRSPNSPGAQSAVGALEVPPRTKPIGCVLKSRRSAAKWMVDLLDRFKRAGIRSFIAAEAECKTRCRWGRPRRALGTNSRAHLASGRLFVRCPRMTPPLRRAKRGWPGTVIAGPTFVSLLRVSRVTPAVTCQARDSRWSAIPDVLSGGLHVEIDRPLARDHVVQAGEGADRVRVRRGSGGDGVNLLLRSRSSSGRPFDLACESGTRS